MPERFSDHMKDTGTCPHGNFIWSQNDPCTQERLLTTKKTIVKLLEGQNIISPQEAETLSESQFEELIVRCADQLADAQSATMNDEQSRQKVRRMLGLTQIDQAVPSMESRQQEIEQLVTEMRDYLRRFKDHLPYVKGFILCGSRMDVKKRPGASSDVDVVILLEAETPTDPRTPEGEKTLFALRDFSDNVKMTQGWDIELDELYSERKFTQVMESTDDRVKTIWGWNPNAVRYIGDLINGQNETEVNEYLQTSLRSAATQKIRRTMVIEAAKKLEGLQEKDRKTSAAPNTAP